MHLLAPLDGLKGAMLTDGPTAHIGAVQVFSTKRACPVCGTSYHRARPAHVQLQQQARLVHHLRRHRPGTDARAAQGLRRLEARRRGQGPRADLPVRGTRGRRRGGCAVPRLPWHAPEPGVARRHLRRRADHRHRPPQRDRRAHLGRRAATRRPRRRHCARRGDRDRQPARVPGRSRPRLPDAGSRGADPLRRRGAAHPPGRAARQQPAGRLLRARRADHRPAPARQPHPARRAAQARRQGQHAGRRRARRGDDPPRRPHHRHRARRRQARWPAGVRGQRRDAVGECRVGDRPFPGEADAPPR